MISYNMTLNSDFSAVQKAIGIHKLEREREGMYKKKRGRAGGAEVHGRWAGYIIVWSKEAVSI